MSTTIPLIDLNSPTAAADLVSACRTIGFANITNHGVPAHLVSSAFVWSQKWFSLPASVKSLAPHPPGFAVHRGYSSPGLEKVSNLVAGDAGLVAVRDVPDYKESYEIGSERNREQPNVWPPEEVLVGFREFMVAFYDECDKASKKVLRTLAVGLGLDEMWFGEMHSGLNNQLRLLHYPPIEARELVEKKRERIPAHADWSSITILFQDSTGGLQVESPKGSGVFIDVKPTEGALVMNVGDLMQYWSNDVLTSTEHRVDVPNDKILTAGEILPSRYSIPYFIAPDPDTVIDCVPTCVAEDNPRKYKPIVQRDYDLMRAAAHYQ